MKDAARCFYSTTTTSSGKNGVTESRPRNQERKEKKKNTTASKSKRGVSVGSGLRLTRSRSDRTRVQKPQSAFTKSNDQQCLFALNDFVMNSGNIWHLRGDKGRIYCAFSLLEGRGLGGQGLRFTIVHLVVQIYIQYFKKRHPIKASADSHTKAVCRRERRQYRPTHTHTHTGSDRGRGGSGPGRGQQTRLSQCNQRLLPQNHILC